MRSAGTLLHITSLPSPYGIGTLGAEARRFADFLSAAGQHYWQILPLGPTGFGDSPYQTFSAFAGNPFLIDLDYLAAEGLVDKKLLKSIDWGKDPEKADFGKIYANRGRVLRQAYARGAAKYREELGRFARENADWLNDYALFMALKDHYNGKPWYQWPVSDRRANAGPEQQAHLSELRDRYAADLGFYRFIQFLFFRQWQGLKDYAGAKAIEFIGDVPIYVPLDSADVWSKPGNYQLDEDLNPRSVAGVPPDGFTADGQLWGNPIYDWPAMARDGYSWWCRRLNAAARLFDVVRIDHFRGLASYWAVPYGDKTARNGTWRPGPGKALIDAIRQNCPTARFIAEDLGYHTDDVQELLDYAGYPGMKILEFAFDSREPSDYLPHNYGHNCVCYAGTHDNATLAQWLREISREDWKYAVRYGGLNEKEGYAEGILRLGMASSADLFVATMQDWLKLGAAARMNRPGSFGTQNWTWRMSRGALNKRLADKIRKMTALYGRSPEERENGQWQR